KFSLYNLALGYYRINDVNNAIRVFREYASKFPGTAESNDALYHVARIMQEIGRYKEAAESYQLVSPNDTVNKMELTYRSADAYLKAGNKDKAIESFRELKTLKPYNNPFRLKGLIELAAILEEKEEYSEVIDVFRKIQQSIDDKKVKNQIDSKIKELEIKKQKKK
ncbi:MAG: tetratricopeptide repeat protein, partial [bacterium]